MKPLLVTVLVVVLMPSGVLTCSAADPIGIVKSISGEALVVRDGRSIKAEPNLRLFEGDLVQTGAGGKAGMILEDDTVISLGTNSRLAIKSFLFRPREKKLSFVARLYQGTAAFISGQIAKLAPNTVRLETPRATVGVRGTHVLVRVD